MNDYNNDFDGIYNDETPDNNSFGTAHNDKLPTDNNIGDAYENDTSDNIEVPSVNYENAEQYNSMPEPEGYDNEFYSDSYYMNESKIGDNAPAQNFYTTNTRPAKKQKYLSIRAAVVAFVCTAVISIAGGAFLSGVAYNRGLLGFGGSMYANRGTVQDNIENSESFKGSSNVSVNKLNGAPLSTPEIVDKVGPAVVGIINKTTYGNAYGYYGRFYGNLDEEIEQSSGSGVIISSDGYIVTNNHVIENATTITVVLNTGDEYQAKLIGRDAPTDLAVIKIDAKGLTYAQMGTSSTLRVGETAIAIGNPLGQEFAGTTTQGIISGLNRSVTIENKTMNLIQTDAAINPGNSGGALVNEYGNLIGINTAKISSETLEGLGFAIPIDEAKPIVQELMTNGYVTGRPVIGIGGRAVTNQDAQAYNLKVGIYVSSLTPSGPADLAGIKIGDVIVECEGEGVETVDDINKIKNKKSPGDQIKLKIYRKDKYIDIKLILGEETPSNE